MTLDEPKILLLYDEERHSEEFILENVVEPYLYFLSERGFYPHHENPEEHYLKRTIKAGLNGFEVTSGKWTNNRFPEFEIDWGEFRFHRLSTGVFYVGEELSSFSDEESDLLLTYDPKKLNIDAILQRLFVPYFKRKGQKYDDLKAETEAIFNSLNGLTINKNVSLDDLSLFSMTRKIPLAFLSKNSAHIFSIGAVGRKDNHTGSKPFEYSYGSLRPSRGVSDDFGTFS